MTTLYITELLNEYTISTDVISTKANIVKQQLHNNSVLLEQLNQLQHENLSYDYTVLHKLFNELLYYNVIENDRNIFCSVTYDIKVCLSTLQSNNGATIRWNNMKFEIALQQYIDNQNVIANQIELIDMIIDVLCNINQPTTDLINILSQYIHTIVLDIIYDKIKHYIVHKQSNSDQWYNTVYNTMYLLQKIDADWNKVFDIGFCAGLLEQLHTDGSYNKRSLLQLIQYTVTRYNIFNNNATLILLQCVQWCHANTECVYCTSVGIIDLTQCGHIEITEWLKFELIHQRVLNTLNNNTSTLYIDRITQKLISNHTQFTSNTETIIMYLSEYISSCAVWSNTILLAYQQSINILHDSTTEFNCNFIQTITDILCKQVTGISIEHTFHAISVLLRYTPINIISSYTDQDTTIHKLQILINLCTDIHSINQLTTLVYCILIYALSINNKPMSCVTQQLQSLLSTDQSMHILTICYEKLLKHKLYLYKCSNFDSVLQHVVSVDNTEFNVSNDKHSNITDQNNRFIDIENGQSITQQTIDNNTELNQLQLCDICKHDINQKLIKPDEHQINLDELFGITIPIIHDHDIQPSTNQSINHHHHTTQPHTVPSTQLINNDNSLLSPTSSVSTNTLQPITMISPTPTTSSIVSANITVPLNNVTNHNNVKSSKSGKFSAVLNKLGIKCVNQPIRTLESIADSSSNIVVNTNINESIPTTEHTPVSSGEETHTGNASTPYDSMYIDTVNKTSPIKSNILDIDRSSIHIRSSSKRKSRTPERYIDVIGTIKHR